MNGTLQDLPGGNTIHRSLIIIHAQSGLSRQSESHSAYFSSRADAAGITIWMPAFAQRSNHSRAGVGSMRKTSLPAKHIPSMEISGSAQQAQLNLPSWSKLLPGSQRAARNGVTR